MFIGVIILSSHSSAILFSHHILCINFNKFLILCVPPYFINSGKISSDSATVPSSICFMHVLHPFIISKVSSSFPPKICSSLFYPQISPLNTASKYKINPRILLTINYILCTSPSPLGFKLHSKKFLIINIVLLSIINKFHPYIFCTLYSFSFISLCYFHPLFENVKFESTKGFFDSRH